MITSNAVIGRRPTGTRCLQIPSALIFGSEIVGCHFFGRNQLALFANKRFLNATVEEVRYVRMFSVSATRRLRSSCTPITLASRLSMLSGAKDHHRQRKLRIMLRHRHIMRV